MTLQFFAKRLFFTLRNIIISKHSAIYSSSLITQGFAQTSRQFHISPGLLKELVRFNLADIGEGIREVTVKEWYIKVGDRVSQFDNICEVQSDKAAVTITSRYDGVVKKIYHEIDETAIVGKPLIDIELDSAMEEDPVVNEAVEVDIDSDDSFDDKASQHKVSTTPSVRKIAKENSINLSDVIPTGPHGRIMKEDVLNYIKNRSVMKEKSMKPAVEHVITKPVEQPHSKTSVLHLSEVHIKAQDTIVPIKGLMKAMFKTMTLANNIPHFSFCDEINMNSMVDMKKKIAKQYTASKITFMPFFIKAASNALLHYPQLNASIDESGDNLVHKACHNIGFALASPDGLIVPKIHNVQSKSIIEIAIEMDALIESGRQGKLSPIQLANGTFTISNIGNIGGTYTKPIILPPEVAIGGIGKIQKLPRYNSKDEVVAMNIMQVSWTADHRVIDGATMAKFSNLWKTYLECPEMLLLYLR